MSDEVIDTKQRRKAFSRRLWRSMYENEIYRPADLARKAGLNAVTMGTYCRGFRHASYDACVKLGKTLGVDPVWLYTGSDEPETVETVSPNVRWIQFTAGEVEEMLDMMGEIQDRYSDIIHYLEGALDQHNRVTA